MTDQTLQWCPATGQEHLKRSPTGTAPLAVYLPVEGIDVSPGVQLLHAAGIRTRMVSADAPDDLPEEERGQVVALLAGYDRVDAALMDRLPALRIISMHSAGVDMVDLEAAAARGIEVSNVPAAATEEVAVHAFALALALSRQIVAFDHQVRSGGWLDEPAQVPRRISTLTCGVLGLGRIGRTFAGLAASVFGRVLGHDPLVLAADWPAGVARVELDELLSAADCVSLHLPLTTATRHLIGAAELRRMQPSAVLVNTSRAEIVYHQALVAALHDGSLGGAALDVLPTEPPAADEPAVTAPNTVLTPHVGYLSAESRADYARIPAQNVVAHLHHVLST